MKKIIAAVICLLTILLLFSCKIGDSNEPSEPSEPGEPGAPNAPGGDTTDDNYLWSPTSELSVVVSTDYDFNVAQKVANQIGRICGKNPALVTDGEGENSHELILGKFDTPISKRAYRKLELLIENTENMSGYLLYAYEGSLCVAVTDRYVQDDAVDALFSRFDDELARLENGVVDYEIGKTVKYISESRETALNERFDTLKQELPVETVDAIRDIYSDFYNEEMYLWFANLYDPVSGGFYYSNSARNTTGFLPDLESTAQALSHFCSSGLFVEYNNSYVKALSDTIKAGLVSFTKDMQSSKDGFFYHPQWGTDITTSRRGRDLGWATSILSKLGEKPLYDTPTGVEGSLGAPGVSSTSMTGRLSHSSVTAVSKVVSVSATPAHLKNETVFKEYLDEFDFANKSYSVGNTMAAQIKQIIAAGLGDFYVEYVCAKQRADNGLWEETLSYSAVNGLFKIGSSIRSCGYSINYLDQAFESAMTMALKPELTPANDAHVCSVYNMWEIMDFLLSSANETHGKEKVNELRKRILDSSVELINVTYKKMSIFKKDDGGFSYKPSGSAENSQGAPVAVKGSVESDVNATCIMSTGVMKDIFSCLGVDFIPMYYAEDGEYFLDVLNSLGAIIKDEVKEYDGVTEPVATFTEGEYDTKYLRNFYRNQTNKDASVPEFYETDLINGFNPITQYDVVKDPFNNSNNVLRVTCIKDTVLGVGYTKITASNDTPTGYCYTLSLRMMYEDIKNKNDVTQIHFQTDKGETLASLRLIANSKKDTVTMKQYNTDGSGTANIDGVSIPVGEWVTLSIEYYHTGVSDAETTTEMMKVYLGKDGAAPTLVSEFESYRPLALEDTRGLAFVKIAHQRTNSSTLYMDDVSLSQTNKAFVSGSGNGGTDTPPTPSTPDNNKPNLTDTTADFENGFVNSGNAVNYSDADNGYAMIPNNATSHNGTEICYSNVSDPTNTNNKVLRVSATHAYTEQPGRTDVSLITKDADGECYAYQTDIYVKNISKTGDTTYFNIRDSKGNAVLRFRLNVNANGTVKLTDYNSVSQHNKTEVARFNTDVWYTLRIEFYRSAVAENNYVKIYLGERSGELKLTYTADAVNVLSNYDITMLRMQHQRTVQSEIYYDNITFVRTNSDYVPDDESSDNDGAGGNEGTGGNESTGGSESTGAVDMSDTDLEGMRVPAKP